jgi:hypothetical protein
VTPFRVRTTATWASPLHGPRMPRARWLLRNGLFCNWTRHEQASVGPSFDLKVGGGGRTRTYEGLASGFTVRPLCRSGHSPASTCMARGRKRPRVDEAGCGEAYVASPPALSTGNAPSRTTPPRPLPCFGAKVDEPG